MPVADTVALPWSELVQTKLRDNTCPDASFAVAESWVVAAGTSDADGADMTTLAVVGGGGGGGPVTLSPQDPISQAIPMSAMERWTPLRDNRFPTIEGDARTQDVAHY